MMLMISSGKYTIPIRILNQLGDFLETRSPSTDGRCYQSESLRFRFENHRFFIITSPCFNVRFSLLIRILYRLRPLAIIFSRAIWRHLVGVIFGFGR